MDIKQQIHDALLTELLKKDGNGRYINLIKLVRHARLTVKCSVDLKNGKGCVDVVVSYPRTIEERGIVAKENHPVTFELITDVGFDAGKKLEQLNRYKQEYEDTRAIIPEEYYQQYGQLFCINCIVVHTWKGIRRWKCRNVERYLKSKIRRYSPIHVILIHARTSNCILWV